MRFDFLQSHAWQVSLGRFVILLVAAFAAGLPWHLEIYTLTAALFGYCLWSLVSLYQIQEWLSSRRRDGTARHRRQRAAAP